MSRKRKSLRSPRRSERLTRNKFTPPELDWEALLDGEVNRVKPKDYLPQSQAGFLRRAREVAYQNHHCYVHLYTYGNDVLIEAYGWF